jgi:hypothetical protein
VADRKPGTGVAYGVLSNGQATRPLILHAGAAASGVALGALAVCCFIARGFVAPAPVLAGASLVLLAGLTFSLTQPSADKSPDAPLAEIRRTLAALLHDLGVCAVIGGGLAAVPWPRAGLAIAAFGLLIYAAGAGLSGGATPPYLGDTEPAAKLPPPGHSD